MKCKGGLPPGTRTPITEFKARRPTIRREVNGRALGLKNVVAGPPGFEPGIAGSEPAGLAASLRANKAQRSDCLCAALVEWGASKTRSTAYAGSRDGRDVSNHVHVLARFTI